MPTRKIFLDVPSLQLLFQPFSISFGQIFKEGGGVEEDVHQSVERLPPQPIDIHDIKKDKDLEEDVREGAAGSTRSEFPRCKDTSLKMAPSPSWNAGPLPAATQDVMLSLEEQHELNADEEWLERIKREHDLAKNHEIGQY
jgi:hypothetical protein